MPGKKECQAHYPPLDIDNETDKPQPTRLPVAAAVNLRKYILDKCQLCESRLRNYFGIDAANWQGSDCINQSQRLTDNISERILDVQLTNFLYDTYLRLLMSTYRYILIAYEFPVSVCLSLALAKFKGRIALWPLISHRMAENVSFKLTRSIDLAVLPEVALAFDELTLIFDAARKNGSMLFLDPLLAEYIEKLPDIASPCNVTPKPLPDMIARDYQDETESFTLQDQNDNDDKKRLPSAEIPPAHFQVRWLSVMQTLYRPRFDNLLVDHTDHHERAYIPVYRFGDDRVASMSMASYIGNTMRRNIRMLYDFINMQLATLSCESYVCPCVVIFNLFVRDHFRVYHSKSLPQTSFIQMYDDKTGKSIKISYMLIANKFPKIAQWFNSINNQFIKKTGYARILQIDAYTRLISSSCNAAVVALSRQAANKSKRTRRRKNISTSPALAFKLRRPGRCTDKKKGVIDGRQPNLCSDGDTPAVTSPSRKPGCRRRVKVTLSHLFKPGQTGDLSAVRPDKSKANGAVWHNQSVILSDVYRSGFLACRHGQVIRVYTQKRAHDESASLSMFCNDCRCYL